MKRLVLIACIFLIATASAQEVQRVVIVPFQGTQGFGSFAIGISASLQRALNVIDGVYAPPIGDAVLVAERAAAAGLEPTATLVELFGTDDVLEGRLQLRGDSMVLELALGDTRREIPMSVDDPERSVALAAGTAFQLLGIELAAADRSAFEQVVAQTPSLPSLGPVSLAGSGLPSPGFGGVASAVDLDPESSWVRAEYARALALEGSFDAALEQAVRATELAAEDVEAWLVLGVIRGATGDADGALVAFERALEINPSHAYAWAGIGRFAADDARAVDALERAIDAYPRLGDAYVLLAERSGSHEQAIEALQRAAPHLPDAVGIHRRMVDRWIAAGNSEAALTYLESTAESPLAASPELYALAVRLPLPLNDAALAFVSQGQARFPESASLAVAAARLHLAADRPEQAVDVLRPRVEAGEAEPNLVNTLAIAHARAGDVDAARALFEGLGDDPSVRFNLGIVLLEAGRPAEALPVFEELVTEGVGPEVRAYYGIALTQVDRIEEGREQLQMALDEDPSLAVAERALGQLNQRVQIGLGDVALSQEQSEAVDRGLFALDQGQFGLAVEEFARARSLGEQGVLAFYHGYALQRNEQIRQAVLAYEAAAEALPESSVVASNLGYAHLQLGRFDRALEELGRARDLDPSNAQAHLNLGLAYYGLSRFQDAVDAWNRAEELRPGITDGIANLREEAQSRVP